ncbi:MULTISPECIES: alpha/beta hydrolase family protein [Prochlorococcus]|uniref:alpha/beta hydrolase family protein n=1 Tax=Prochlorococcus TaxID=1218 RepID=UPI0005336EDA|nr:MULTISPECIES: prolyl oligopeptidase family serine peptidase [Prochlorococcus]KGG13313.1 Esterase/lipase/thioesterase family active site [Prochlorococcus sp. MIT 0601]
MDKKHSSKNQKFIDAEFALGQIPKIKSPKLIRNWIIWLEQRPYEQGRTTLMARPWGNSNFVSKELTSNTVNIKSRLHGYGGGEYACANLGNELIITWIDDIDQGLWLQKWSFQESSSHGQVTEIKESSTPICLCVQEGYIVADGLIDLERNRWIGVMEKNKQDYLVCFSLDAAYQAPQILYKATDFIGYPSLSPDAKKLSWVEWQNPYMPWDSSQICLGLLDGMGELFFPSILQKIKDFNTEQNSIFQPIWLTNGQLVLAEESSGWWNLAVIAADISEEHFADFHKLWPMKVELASPQWISGISTISPIENGILALGCEEAKWSMQTLDKQGIVQKIQLPFHNLSSLSSERHKAVAIASNSYTSPGLLEVDLKTGEWKHQASKENLLNSADISSAQSFWFKGFGGAMTHAWYYPPIQGRSAYSPLLVKAHSGPTSMTNSGLDLEIQFWTSRGWTVLDVNYSGSSGFGRAYRDRLKNKWGEADVVDCSAAALELVEAGKVDQNLIAIEGSSAGGFTALCCLCFTKTFKVASCKYPVSDLIAMQKSTHRFEEYYLDYLVGKFETYSKLYESRSPINNVEKIDSPLILFQGMKDQVVLPEQTINIFQNLDSRNIPVELYTYKNEGHGFRNGNTRVDVLKKTESFFRKHLLI